MDLGTRLWGSHLTCVLCSEWLGITSRSIFKGVWFIDWLFTWNVIAPPFLTLTFNNQGTWSQFHLCISSTISSHICEGSVKRLTQVGMGLGMRLWSSRPHACHIWTSKLHALTLAACSYVLLCVKLTHSAIGCRWIILCEHFFDKTKKKRITVYNVN